MTRYEGRYVVRSLEEALLSLRAGCLFWWPAILDLLGLDGGGVNGLVS